MKKITDFIIDKRYIVLTIFIILTIVCGIISQKVKINYDIAKYLPSDSETRIGMDIMEDEFETTTSSLNIMFNDLPQDEKQEIYEYLKSVPNVKEVDYDDTEEYNIDNHTLYKITVDAEADSDVAKQVYKEITTKYKEYSFDTNGDVSQYNKPVLHTWIIVLAVACALVILIIMCDSYVEPFLFLFAILMAVVLNKGTNIMFKSISNITESICAILQMALSMDYSIMLMNRYVQEKKTEKDNVKAMKEALYHAFSSISSSSVTTIVGLLALVFMSFTIGKDLGFVLAKGVLFSLLTIFCVLPALILMCDKLITKTQKKVPVFKLDGLGKVCYKLRFVAVPVFILAFVGSYFLQGNLKIEYTGSENDEVETIFGTNNQMAIIYNKDDEEKIANLVSELEKEEKITKVLAYSNTINQNLKYQDLNAKFADLGEDVTVEDYLLKIIYYNYYNRAENNTMSFNEFVRFVKSNVYNNEKMSKVLDDETRANIDRLANFTSSEEVNKQRTASEIANILEINEEDVEDILVLYSSKNNDVKLSLNEFVKFMNEEVLPSKYASYVSDDSKQSLKQLEKYSNNNTINNKLTAAQMAEVFGMDKETTNALYTYYISKNDVNTKLSLNEFANFVLTNVAGNSNYSSLLTEETIKSLETLKTYSDEEFYDKQMNATQIAQTFGIDENIANSLLLMNYQATQKLTASPYEFITIVLSNEQISGSLDAKTVQTLKLAYEIINSSKNNVQYTYAELAKFVSIDENMAKEIYSLYEQTNTPIALTPYEFVNFVLAHKSDEKLAASMNSEVISNLNLVNKIMTSAKNNTKYTNSELSNFLGMEEEKINLLYGLYSYKVDGANHTMSLNNMVSFILSDVVTNADYSSKIDDSSKSKLEAISDIMANTDTKYNKEDLFNKLSKLADNIDKNTIDLLYIYYGSENEYDENWTMTIEKFVDFINDDILTDSRFDDFIEDDMKQQIIDAKTTVADAKNLLIGDSNSRIVLNTDFGMEDEDTQNFIQRVKDWFNENGIQAYIIGDSPMAYEMSQSFAGELNFITILTMVAIFVVVAITFKSILIPLILVLTIQCAVYMTMGFLSLSGDPVYFIALLIVQSILMGATIDYAIVYTSYYLEHRKTMGIKEAIINSYNKSIHTIVTSASILILVTLIVGKFASAIAAMICRTISAGTLCSAILIIILLPAVLSAFDKFIIKKK